jgi:hypothetical protein
MKATRWARRDDAVLQNANYNSTGSSPMAQEAWPHRATPLPCVLGYHDVFFCFFSSLKKNRRHFEMRFALPSAALLAVAAAAMLLVVDRVRG